MCLQSAFPQDVSPTIRLELTQAFRPLHQKTWISRVDLNDSSVLGHVREINVSGDSRSELVGDAAHLRNRWGRSVE
jgi:hypothetical protein